MNKKNIEYHLSRIYVSKIAVSWTNEREPIKNNYIFDTKQEDTIEYISLRKADRIFTDFIEIEKQKNNLIVECAVLRAENMELKRKIKKQK